MSDIAPREKALNAYGPILIKQGYEWVDLDDVARVASVDVAEVSREFPNKALLCEAWMERTDGNAKKHHAGLLRSGLPKRDILKNYFDELEKFMKDQDFSGCPFTNTARAHRGQSANWVTRRVQEHKDELRSFFRRLSESVTDQPEIVSEAYFLIYSGATTESANIRSLQPIQAGRQASLSLFDMYAN